jgi:hypothetical protein
VDLVEVDVVRVQPLQGASICSKIARRDSPRPPGPEPIGANSLVASTTWSRLVYFRMAACRKIG